MYTQISGY
jgi:hypothetical protein